MKKKKKKKSASAGAAPAAAADAGGGGELPPSAFGKKTKLKKKKKKAPPPTSDAAAAASPFGKVAKMKRKKSVPDEGEAVEVAEDEVVEEEEKIVEEDVAEEGVTQETTVTELVAEDGAVAEEKVAIGGGGNAAADGNNNGADAPSPFGKKVKRRKSVAAAPPADNDIAAADARDAPPSPFGKEVKRRKSIAASAPVETGAAAELPSETPASADASDAPPWSPFGKKVKRRKSIAASAAAPQLPEAAPPPPMKKKKKKVKAPPPAAPTTSVEEAASVRKEAAPPPPAKRKKKKKSRAAPPPALAAAAVIGGEAAGSPVSNAAAASVATSVSEPSATGPVASAAEVPNTPLGLAAQSNDVEVATAVPAAADTPSVAESKELVVGEREDADAEIIDAAVAETKAAPAERDEPLVPVVGKRKSRRRSTARARPPPPSLSNSQVADEPTMNAEAPPPLVKKKKKSLPVPPSPRAAHASEVVVAAPRSAVRRAAPGTAPASAPATSRAWASSPASDQSSEEIRLLLWLHSQGVNDVHSMEKLLAARSGVAPDPTLGVATAIAELQREMDASKKQARMAVARAKRVEAKLSSLKMMASQSREHASDPDSFSSSPTAFEARVALAYKRSQRGAPAPASPTPASGITSTGGTPVPGSFAATLLNTMSDMDRAVDAVLTATQENVIHKPGETGSPFANADAGGYRRSLQVEVGSSASTAVPRYRASPSSAPSSPSYRAKARALTASTPELPPSEIDLALQLHDGHFGRASVQLALDRDFTVAALAGGEPMRRDMAITLVERHHGIGLTFHAAVGALRDEGDSMEWAQLRLGILRGHPELSAPDSRARALRLRRATGSAGRNLSVEQVARALSEANNHFGRARLLLQLDRQGAPLRGAV